jgi:hypothetical protein
MREGLDPASGQLVEAENTHALALAMARPLEAAAPRNFILASFDLTRTIKHYHALINKG